MKTHEVYAYTLDEIYQERNEQLKNELLSLRMELITSLATNRISRKIILENKNLSIAEIEELIQNANFDNTSTLYFPNNLCCFYPRIRELKSKSIRTCAISGALIMPGTLYYDYRPMIDNLTTGRTYVLKKDIITELGYYDFFPQTLYEFEDLATKLGNSFEIESDSYNYYELSKSIGEYLPLQELRKKKVRK